MSNERDLEGIDHNNPQNTWVFPFPKCTVTQIGCLKSLLGRTRGNITGFSACLSAGQENRLKAGNWVKDNDVFIGEAALSEHPLLIF